MFSIAIDGRQEQEKVRSQRRLPKDLALSM